jgi:2-polyprenyl-3-methyl-5-hydroxy-6-metoxy-1,4-benzoquinol methylase
MKKGQGYKEFPCDVCGNSDAVELPHVRKYTGGQVIHICKTCGFVYVKKRRPFDVIAEVWSKQLFGKAYTARTPLMLARHTYIAEFLDQSLSLKKKTVCDIGAGEGQFLRVVRDSYAASVFGVEPSAANCRLLTKQKIASFKGTLEEYMAQAKKKTADIVTMMWTLENATSPNDLIAGSRGILKDDGHLVIATGSRILVPFAKPLNMYLSANPVDAHPSRFSIRTLTSMLLKNGFEVTAVNPYVNDSLVMCVVAKKISIPRRPKLLKDDHRKIADYFERWHKETKHYL